MPAIPRGLASSLPPSRQHHFSRKKCFTRTKNKRVINPPKLLLRLKNWHLLGLPESRFMPPPDGEEASTNLYINLNINSRQQQVINHTPKSRDRLFQDSNESSIGKGRSGDGGGNGPSGGGGSRKNYGDSYPEMPEPAKTEGIRYCYSDLLKMLVAFLMGACFGQILINLLPNSLFLLKTFSEVFTAFAIFMEFHKKGNDFSQRIFIVTNMLVGVIASIELPDMVARMGPKLSLSFSGFLGHLLLAFASLASRSTKKSEEDIPASRAALLCVFYAVSSSPLAKVLPVALAFTVGIRVMNNIYGKLQFGRTGQNGVEC